MQSDVRLQKRYELIAQKYHQQPDLGALFLLCLAQRQLH